MIRKCTVQDFETIYHIINDAAVAYKGVIPDDRWHEPYMTRHELQGQIQDGIQFWGYQDEGQELSGVMGIQDKGEVTLIRHAYVITKRRKGGIGSQLLHFLNEQTEKPILIGTWASATWAITFYQKNGFVLVDDSEKDQLLHRFWGVPKRQIETSVVLADPKWFATNGESIRMDNGESK